MSVVTKIKMYVGKCIGGEVGGFKDLHVKTKTTQQSFKDLPVVRTLLNVKTEPEPDFRAVFFFKGLHPKSFAA